MGTAYRWICVSSSQVGIRLQTQIRPWVTVATPAPGLTLPLFSAATLCAASLAIALATLSEMSVPLGWGRILCGEGERRLVGGGGSREWLWMEEGEQVGL